jgi:hypothetical protein
MSDTPKIGSISNNELWRSLNAAHKTIKFLQEEIKRMKEQITVVPLKEVMPEDFPESEVYGVPCVFSGNRVWPWPTEDVILYAALKVFKEKDAAIKGEP